MPSILKICCFSFILGDFTQIRNGATTPAAVIVAWYDTHTQRCSARTTPDQRVLPSLWDPLFDSTLISKHHSAEVLAHEQTGVHTLHTSGDIHRSQRTRPGHEITH